MNDNELSEKCIALAAALNDVRSRLYAIVKSGSWPQGSFDAISTVLVSGRSVEHALIRLGTDAEPK
jgi:hypothetical protein